jgi:hypothetical protein
MVKKALDAHVVYIDMLRGFIQQQLERNFFSFTLRYELK